MRRYLDSERHPSCYAAPLVVEIFHLNHWELMSGRWSVFPCLRLHHQFESRRWVTTNLSSRSDLWRMDWSTAGIGNAFHIRSAAVVVVVVVYIVVVDVVVDGAVVDVVACCCCRRVHQFSSSCLVSTMRTSSGIFWVASLCRFRDILIALLSMADFLLQHYFVS